MLVVSVFDKEAVHKGTILDLELKVATLEAKVSAQAEIDTAQAEVIAVVEELQELSEKEAKRLKNKAFWKNIWSKGKEGIIAFVCLAAGVGIGSAVP
jgi:predicted ATPase